MIDDPRIGEILISDDCSTDGSYERLLSLFAGNPKIKVRRNNRNMDCYANKHQAVLHANLDWVILFDDDNIIDKTYLDLIYSIPQWKLDTIYCPDFAKPHFDYRRFSGITVSRRNISAMMEVKHFPTLLNTANYFVPKVPYLATWQGSVNPHTADSLFMAFNWLRSDKKMYVVPGLSYFHRVHEGSHFKRNNLKTGVFWAQLRSKLKQLR